MRTYLETPRLALFVAFALHAGTAVAFDGLYRPAGEEFEGWDCVSVGQDGGAIQLIDGEIRSIGSLCRLEEVKTEPDGTTKFEAQCAGEGEEWSETITLKPSPSGLIYGVPEIDFEVEWLRCDTPASIMTESAPGGSSGTNDVTDQEDTTDSEEIGRGKTAQMGIVSSRNCPECDFSNQDLSGMNGSRGLYDGADFSGANLTGARFLDASLLGARFTGAILDGAVFNRSVLDGADFTGASMRDVRLIGTSVRTSTLVGVDLTGARMRETDFTYATLVGVDMSAAIESDFIARHTTMCRVREEEEAWIDRDCSLPYAQTLLDSLDLPPPPGIMNQDTTATALTEAKPQTSSPIVEREAETEAGIGVEAEVAQIEDSNASEEGPESLETAMTAAYVLFPDLVERVYAGDPEAMGDLGYRFYLGSEVPANETLALRLLAEGSLGNDCYAQANFGRLLNKGDFTLDALMWFEMSQEDCDNPDQHRTLVSVETLSLQSSLNAAGLQRVADMRRACAADDAGCGVVKELLGNLSPLPDLARIRNRAGDKKTEMSALTSGPDVLDRLRRRHEGVMMGRRIGAACAEVDTIEINSLLVRIGLFSDTRSLSSCGFNTSGKAENHDIEGPYIFIASGNGADVAQNVVIDLDDGVLWSIDRQARTLSDFMVSSARCYSLVEDTFFDARPLGGGWTSCHWAPALQFDPPPLPDGVNPKLADRLYEAYFVEPIAIFQSSVDQAGLLSLGLRFAEGRGVTKDVHLSARLLETVAVDNDDCVAAKALGDLIYNHASELPWSQASSLYWTSRAIAGCEDQRSHRDLVAEARADLETRRAALGGRFDVQDINIFIEDGRLCVTDSWNCPMPQFSDLELWTTSPHLIERWVIERYASEQVKITAAGVIDILSISARRMVGEEEGISCEPAQREFLHRFLTAGGYADDSASIIVCGVFRDSTFVTWETQESGGAARIVYGTKALWYYPDRLPQNADVMYLEPQCLMIETGVQFPVRKTENGMLVCWP